MSFESKKRICVESKRACKRRRRLLSLGRRRREKWVKNPTRISTTKTTGSSEQNPFLQSKSRKCTVFLKASSSLTTSSYTYRILRRTPKKSIISHHIAPTTNTNLHFSIHQNLFHFHHKYYASYGNFEFSKNYRIHHLAYSWKIFSTRQRQHFLVGFSVVDIRYFDFG